MTPFRVQCETCQARLRVNDPAVVGQIHACPKCGGMVLLAAPIDKGAAAGRATDEPNEPTETTSPEAPAPTFEANLDESVAIGPNAVPSTLKAMADAEPEPEALPTPPTSSVASRWTVWAVAGSALLVAAGIGVASLFVDADQVVEANPTEPPPPAAVPAKSQALVEEPEPTVVLKPQSPTSETPAPEPAPPELPPLPVDAEPFDPKPFDPKPFDEEPQAIAPPAAPSSDPPALPDPEPPPVNAGGSNDNSGPIDPLAFDPLGAELIMIAQGATPPPVEDTVTAAPESDVEVADAPPANDEQTQRVAALDRKLGKLAAEARATVRRGPTGPAPEAPAEPLAVVVPEIALADAPLDRTLRLLGGIAGAPITIDPATLRYAGIAASKRVGVNGRDETVGALIAQFARRLRLEVASTPRGLMLVRTSATTDRDTAYRVADLFDPATPDAGAIAEFVRQMLPTTAEGIGPAQVTTEGDKLRIFGPAAVHMDAAVLLERLRKARGVKQATRYPADLLATKSPLAELAATLDRHTTFTFVDYTPLDVVLDHWRRVTKLTILVDWAELRDAGLAPTTTIAASVHDKSWANAMTAVLGELGLTWRAVDAETIQITTKAAALAHYSTEFYPLPSDAQDPAALTERLASRDSGAAAFFDASSGTLIVRGAQADHAWMATQLADE